MSQLRTSSSQPQGPAFTAKVEQAAKVEQPAKILSAKQASTTAKQAKQGPAQEPIILKDGAKGQCQVLMGTKQCSNPANYKWSTKTTTCRTHYKRLQAGKVYRFTTTKQAYDKSLWGGPQDSKEATKTA